MYKIEAKKSIDRLTDEMLESLKKSPKAPWGKAKRIKLSEIEMCDSCNCILGHMYGNFYEADRSEIGLFDKMSFGIEAYGMLEIVNAAENSQGIIGDIGYFSLRNELWNLAAKNFIRELRGNKRKYKTKNLEVV